LLQIGVCLSHGEQPWTGVKLLMAGGNVRLWRHVKAGR